MGEWLRCRWEQRGKKVRSKTAYPYSVTAGNFVYFIAAPTLVYESHYARSERIRKRYVLKKTLQGAGCALLQYVLMAQFILPVLRYGGWVPAYAMLVLVQRQYLMCGASCGYGYGCGCGWSQERGGPWVWLHCA